MTTHTVFFHSWLVAGCSHLVTNNCVLYKLMSTTACKPSFCVTLNRFKQIFLSVLAQSVLKVEPERICLGKVLALMFI